jgi:hypothetical protein
VSFEAVIISEPQLEVAVQKLEAIRAKGPLYLKASTAKEKRSIEQNARYWGGVLPQIAEQVKVNDKLHPVASWHEYFKFRFLGAEEIEMPDGKTFVAPLSTAKLSVGEFGNYMTCVEAWGAERGVIFNDLPECFWE